MEAASTETWIGVSVIGISTFGGVMTGFFALMKLMIEKKYDAMFIKMKDDLEHCQKSHADSERDRCELREMISKANERAEVAEKAAKESEKRIAELELRLDEQYATLIQNQKD